MELVFAVSKDSVLGTKLAELQRQYDHDVYALSDALDLLRDKIESTARKMAHRTKINFEDFISAAHQGVWEAFDKYDGSRCFTSHISHVVSCRLLDAGRGSAKNYAERVTLASPASHYDDEKYVQNNSIEFQDGVAAAPNTLTYVSEGDFDMIQATSNVEAEVIDRLMIEKQRDLIDHLYENAPEDVRLYVNEMYDRGKVRFTPSKKKSRDKSRQKELEELTMNQIAKKYGVHHSKVTRSIRRLRNFYDSKKFGNQSDYLFRAREQFPRY
jgi:RNA polymerase sigma factor (sigma-70 family)